MVGTSQQEPSRSENTNSIVGYFRSGDDARKALDELVENGFSASQIGAAFHSSSTGSGSAAAGSSDAREEMSATDRPLINPDTTGVGSGGSGVASGTTAVTPAGLSTGSGTGTAGAGRPGPIPGSEIPHHRSGSATSTSYSDSPVAARTGITPASADKTVDSTTGPLASSYERTETAARTHASGSWWDKLKHIFESDESHTTNRTITEDANKSAQNFGSGEGRLNVAEASYDYPYSGAAFEKSFSNFGIPAEHSRHLARQLGGGGAVITVRAGSHLAEAERILTSNGGSVRFEPGTGTSGLEDWVDQGNTRRVEVFGEIQRYHRRPASGTTADAETADPTSIRPKRAS